MYSSWQYRQKNRSLSVVAEDLFSVVDGLLVVDLVVTF